MAACVYRSGENDGWLCTWHGSIVKERSGEGILRWYVDWGQVLECYCGICSWVCGTGDPQGEMGLQKWTEKKGDPHVG